MTDDPDHSLKTCLIQRSKSTEKQINKTQINKVALGKIKKNKTKENKTKQRDRERTQTAGGIRKRIASIETNKPATL